MAYDIGQQDYEERRYKLDRAKAFFERIHDKKLARRGRAWSSSDAKESAVSFMCFCESYLERGEFRLFDSYFEHVRDIARQFMPAKQQATTA